MNKFILLSALVAMLGTSCATVIVTPKKDNGKHKGWYKNRHNPHHPNSNNPGHQKKENGKDKKDDNGNKKKFYRLNLA